MNDSHRLFLQCFIAKPFMSEEDTKNAYTKSAQAFQGNDDPENFDRFVNVTNKALRPLFLEIRKGVSEDDGKQYYGLVNGSEDQISKFATSYTAHDVEFFRKVMDLVVQSEDGTVTSVELLHGAHDLEKAMAASQAEKLLGLWVKDKWLSESVGNYWLGPRAVLELHPYLKRVYEEFIVDCKICMDIVLRGQSCVACDVKLHHHCAARYFRGRDSRKCPGCSIDWPHAIDETNFQTDETNSEPASSQIVPSNRNQTRRRTRR